MADEATAAAPAPASGRRKLPMIVGGVVAGIGLRNPPREKAYDPPRAAAAGECAHSSDHLDDTPRREGEPVAEPA